MHLALTDENIYDLEEIDVANRVIKKRPANFVFI